VDASVAARGLLLPLYCLSLSLPHSPFACIFNGKPMGDGAKLSRLRGAEAERYAVIWS